MKVKIESEVVQSCLTPNNPMDCSLPGSSVHEIFQARVLEWGAIAFSEKEHCSVIKRNQLVIHAATWMNLMDEFENCLQKEADKRILYDSIYIKLWELQIYNDRK